VRLIAVPVRWVSDFRSGECHSPTFASSYSAEVGPAEMLAPNVFTRYATHSRGEKFLVNPQPATVSLSIPRTRAAVSKRTVREPHIVGSAANRHTNSLVRAFRTWGSSAQNAPDSRSSDP
jgi:hypothetical protein